LSNRNAVEEASSTPMRSKRTNFAHRTPVSLKTPSTFQKVSKRTKPSFTPVTPPAVENKLARAHYHNNHNNNNNRLEEGAAHSHHNTNMQTPVRAKSPMKTPTRSCSTPPARPMSHASQSLHSSLRSQTKQTMRSITPPPAAVSYPYSRASQTQKGSKNNDNSSLFSARSAPTVVQRGTHLYQSEQQRKQQQEEQEEGEDCDDLSHTRMAIASQAILYSPATQTIINRGTTTERNLSSVAVTVAAAAHHQGVTPVSRASSAPRPRPSPLSFVMRSPSEEQETRNHREQTSRTTASANKEREKTIGHDAGIDNLYPTKTQHNHETTTPKKANNNNKTPQKKPNTPQRSTTTSTPSGFTAEQLSEYKARKRAILTAKSGKNSSNAAVVHHPVVHSVINNNGEKIERATTHYSAPTMSAYLRNKELQQQVVVANKKNVLVSPPSHLPSPAITGGVTASRRISSSPLRSAVCGTEEKTCDADTTKILKIVQEVEKKSLIEVDQQQNIPSVSSFDYTTSYYDNSNVLNTSFDERVEPPKNDTRQVRERRTACLSVPVKLTFSFEIELFRF
jgi:hypothetical protein